MNINTIAAFYLLSVGLLISSSSEAAEAFQVFSPAQPVNADYSLSQSAEVYVRLGQEASFPAQFIVLYHFNDKAAASASKTTETKSNSELVLLQANSNSGISPSWFYLMLVVLLLIALCWDDDHEKYFRRKRK